MTRQEIINFEQAANGESITLLKEGMFWRAYEQSAYLFEKLFWPGLKVNGGFVKSAGKDMFYVGFPDTSLQKIIDKIPEVAGALLAERSANRVVVANVPAVEGFDEWKKSFALLREQANEQMQPFYGRLPLYKAVYDFFQQMVNLTRHFPKDLQYTLGDKIVTYSLEMNTLLYRVLHLSKSADDAGTKELSIARIEEILETIRFLLRTSFDMKLYNVERFADVSAQLESIGKQLSGWKKKH